MVIPELLLLEVSNQLIYISDVMVINKRYIIKQLKADLKTV